VSSPPARESARPTLLVIAGPTATGKTALGVRLARRFGGGIVSADALQVYRGLDAATAKPGAEELAACPHELVDAVDPRRDFNLGDFVRAAEAAIARLAGEGRLPILVGGTGLYVRGLLKGVFEGPRRDEGLRSRLLRRAGPRGGPLLHRYLRRLDPAAASRIAPADLQRVVRALEVALLTGRPLSEQQSAWRGPDRYPAIKIGLTTGREILYRRIDERVLRFFDRGLVEEVRGLLAGGLPRGANALKGLGYRQVLEHLEGRRGLPETVALVQRETRRYAKRQLTWFRKEEGLRWFDTEGEDYPGGVERYVAARLAEGPERGEAGCV
jgi:tRNA dimethylallyltransferase